MRFLNRLLKMTVVFCLCGCTDGLLNSTGGSSNNSCGNTSSFGQAVSLDGTTGYVRITGSPVMQLGSGSQITIEGFFKPNTTSITQTLFSDGINELKLGSAGTPSSRVISSGCISTVGTSSGFVFSAGTKYHIAMTFDGSTGVQTFYQNGTYLMSVSGIPSASCSSSTVQFGYSSTGGFFNGTMDELRISNSIRYTGTFTPPTTPFQCDFGTIAIYRSDSTSLTYTNNSSSLSLLGGTSFVASPFP